MKPLAVAVCLALLAVTIPATATDTVDFSDGNGTLFGTTAGLTLSGSTLIAVVGLNGGTLGHIGSVPFNTGALTSRSLEMGKTFTAGGTFTISGNGSNGIPSGVLFSGTLSAPVTWSLIMVEGETHNYTLTGVLSGMMNGTIVNGVTVQLTFNTGEDFFAASALTSGGDTIIASVPEPSTLALLSTGTVGMMGMFRRRLSAR
jgi:hypothetical protein